MSTQAEVIRLLLTDVSLLVSESTDAERALQTFIDDLGKVAETTGDKLAKAFLDEKATSNRLAYNRSELDVWEKRAALAADSQDHHLVQKALKWKSAHGSILTALRDHQVELEKDIQNLQHQVAALQAIAADAKARQEIIVARKQQTGIR